MKRKLNSEYLLSIEDVSVNVIIDYERKTYQITEAHQEGVFYGNRKNIKADCTKVSVLFEVMKFVVKKLGESDYEPFF